MYRAKLPFFLTRHEIVPVYIISRKDKEILRELIFSHASCSKKRWRNSAEFSQTSSPKRIFLKHFRQQLKFLAYLFRHFFSRGRLFPKTLMLKNVMFCVKVRGNSLSSEYSSLGNGNIEKKVPHRIWAENKK